MDDMHHKQILVKASAINMHHSHSIIPISQKQNHRYETNSLQNSLSRNRIIHNYTYKYKFRMNITVANLDLSTI